MDTMLEVKMDCLKVVKEFGERISSQDLDGMYDLMNENHRFIDGLGNMETGRDKMKEGWYGYFQMVPDYWIKIEKVFYEGNGVAAFGKAGGTYSKDGSLYPENRWEVPAAWYAEVENGKITEWRVYADNEPIRQIMKRVES